jgi:hypothetical protein
MSDFDDHKNLACYSCKRRVKITIGNFKLDINQKYLERAQPHFWSVIRKTIKQEEKKHGIKKRPNTASRPGKPNSKVL